LLYKIVCTCISPQSASSFNKVENWKPQCQDTLDPGQFGPRTFWHHQTGAEMSKQFGTSAEVSRGHLGTGTELSRPPANIFATIGRTEVRLLLSKRTTGLHRIHRRRLATILTYVTFLTIRLS